MKTKFNGFLTLLLALMVQITFAQQKTVTGVVSDTTGPLPGVTVVVKGTDTGTQTDFDGNYSISADTGSVLQYSFVGMEQVEISIGSDNVMNVVMKESAEMLDEVVVTALGIKRKPKEMAYSVSNLKGDEITQTKSANVATAMVGKVSGLQINTTSNGVDPNTRVVLRGNRSLLGNNEALIVVDGFPSSRGVLDRINPDDIQSVSVLKGANASALYGSDASNGVIILTTKKGSGKLSVTLSTTYQMESVSYMPEFQDEFGAGGFPDGTLYPLENVNWGPRYDGRMVDASETLNNGDVWQVPFTPIKNNHRDFFDLGGTARNGITVSGGDESSDFLMSIDNVNTTGIVPKDTYNKTNFRLKGSRTYNKLTVGGNVSFFRSHANTVAEEAGRQDRPVYWNVINTPLHVPLAEMKNWRTGEFTRNEVSYYRFYENPYFIIDTQREKTDRQEFNIVANVNYDFNDWISASVNAGYTGATQNYKKEFEAFTYAFHLDHVYSEMDPYGAETADYIFNSTRFNSDILVTMQKDLGTDFNAKLILGQNTRITGTKQVGVNGENLIIPEFYNVSTRTGDLGGYEESFNYRKLGVYADFTLGYKDYLFLNATARNDWSSTLPVGNNSFFYPGVGVSFIASQAIPSIVSEKGGLSYLKANFSVSKTGNDPGIYALQSIFFAPDNFPYGSTAGLSQSSRDTDPTLNPEFTTSIEAGLELGFWNQRILANITAYKTNSTDQIIPVNTSYASGALSNLINVGEIQNLGLEVDLNTAIIRSSDWSWDVGINYSGYKSEVISLVDGIDELDIGGYAAAQVVAKVGESYPLLRTTSYVRDDQGRVVVGDNGNPLQDSKNQVQGKTTPDYVVGVNTSLKYKNFNLYVVADYRTGHVFFNSLVDALEFTGLTQHSVTAGRQPFVFPNSSYADGSGGFTENTNRLTDGGGNAFWDAYNEVKENYVTDATTLKLREVLLSYSFDSELISSIGLSDLSLGLFGKNLLTYRPKENVYTDPEFNFTTGNAMGVGSQAQTPPTRTYGVNLTVKF